MHDRRLSGLPAALFRALTPAVEREEVLNDLAVEYSGRAVRQGR